MIKKLLLLLVISSLVMGQDWVDWNRVQAQANQGNVVSAIPKETKAEESKQIQKQKEPESLSEPIKQISAQQKPERQEKQEEIREAQYEPGRNPFDRNGGEPKAREWPRINEEMSEEQKAKFQKTFQHLSPEQRNQMRERYQKKNEFRRKSHHKKGRMEGFRGEQHQYEGHRDDNNMVFTCVAAFCISLGVFCLVKKCNRHSVEKRQRRVRERAFNQNMNQSVSNIVSPVTVDQQIQFHANQIERLRLQRERNAQIYYDGGYVAMGQAVSAPVQRRGLIRVNQQEY